jgi:hypothetical protein
LEQINLICTIAPHTSSCCAKTPSEESSLTNNTVWKEERDGKKTEEKPAEHLSITSNSLSTFEEIY